MGNYADADQVKEFLGISGTNIDQDENITRALAAAERLIDNETGRVFTLAGSASARTFAPSVSDGVLLTDDIGTTTGLVVELGTFGSSSWSTVAATDYEVTPLNALTKGQPVTGIYRPHWGLTAYTRIRVTAKWGWPSVPSEVTQAAILQAARLHKRKDSPGGMYGSADWGFSRVSKADPDVMALIQHLVLPGFGG